MTSSFHELDGDLREMFGISVWHLILLTLFGVVGLVALFVNVRRSKRRR